MNKRWPLRMVPSRRGIYQVYWHAEHLGTLYDAGEGLWQARRRNEIIGTHAVSRPEAIAHLTQGRAADGRSVRAG